jgi:mRNA-degrading endonuclease toxin of MazEF toxin-antitoxin module
LRTAISAPLTSTDRVALDQIRAVDPQRLVRKPGTARAKAAQQVSSVLVEMFTR